MEFIAVNSRHYVTLFVCSILTFSMYARGAQSFDGAPCWVTNIDCVSGENLAVGISHIPYQTSPHLSHFQAQQNALTNLAMTITSKIQTSLSVQSFKNSRFSANAQLASYQSASVNSEIELFGIRFIDKWIDENGALYILITANAYQESNVAPNIHRLPRNYAVESRELDDEIIEVNMEYAQKLKQQIRNGVQAYLD